MLKIYWPIFILLTTCWPGEKKNNHVGYNRNAIERRREILQAWSSPKAASVNKENLWNHDGILSLVALDTNAYFFCRDRTNQGSLSACTHQTQE